jgi:hypothetical protein
MPNPIRLADEAGDSVRQVIRAYHGSPYDFDRFDASKIGTGEGLQAYGHGLYFAGEEGVAQHYRDILSADEDIPLPWPLSDEYAQVYQDFLTTSTKEGEWRRLNPGRLLEDNPFQSQLEKASAAFSDVRRRADEATKVPGKVYEVEIAHPEKNLLDLDAMPNEQSPLVRNALEKLGLVSPGPITPRNNISGFAAIRRLSEDRSPAEAAKALLGEGVPGARYFDGISRAQKDGSRNYVMFPGTEDQIRILRKYGLMAPVAAGAASQYNAPNETPDPR